MWNYHEQLNALSCALLCRDASTLCLVLPAAAMDGQIDAHKQGKRNHDAKDGAETSLSRDRAALAALQATCQTILAGSMGDIVKGLSPSTTGPLGVASSLLALYMMAVPPGKPKKA